MRVLLDANVLVDAQLRDLPLRAAEGGLVDVRWSDRILEETHRTLTKQLGLPLENVVRLLDAPDRCGSSALLPMAVTGPPRGR
ncbi:MAG: PIN domain-containing protein [Egibacteraceae bacterium]